MTDSASSPDVEYFDADTLKELRENARVYQRLDLAYLVAGSAIVTALKLNNNALLEFAAQLWAVVIAFLIFFAVDTYVEQFVFSDWIAAKISSKKRRSIRFIKRALGIQPAFHLMFICLVISGALGFSIGVARFRDEFRALAGIQDATELFIATKQRPPASIAELIAETPVTSHWHDVLKRQPIRFEADSKEIYRIFFAGKDGMFGTPDDEIVTSVVKLRKILSGIDAKECK